MRDVTNQAALPADPKRQAEAMLRGVEYQVWQTVSAWLDLRRADQIYIEGAEDFDTVGETRAEAVQVKASTSPVSLGQKEIQEALNNFWKLRQSAPTASFRFLTRAAFTVEKKQPFGKKVAGLELWNRSALTDSDVQTISDFLQACKAIDSELKNWLKTAKPDEVRSQLIARVFWQTHAADIEFVERAVYGKLATFGQTRGYVPAASKIKQIANKLVDEVWRVIRKPAPRSLDVFRLIELWDEETRVTIPSAELDRRVLQGAASPATSPPLLRRGLPPLPGAVAQRTKLVEDVRAILGLTGLVDFHGSTRMGKTTLAKLVAVADADNWSWWSGARKSGDQVQRELALVLQEVNRDPTITSLILDDLDFSPVSSRGFEELLGEVLAVIRGRRGRIMLTSQKSLPVRLQVAFGIDSRQIISIPRLDIKEVEELALALGCTDDKRREVWGRFVHAWTHGHPQLAAVHLFVLRDREWPELTGNTLQVASTEIDAEKADARQLLAEVSADQRTLLNRVTIFPTMFRRDHAVAIGSEAPTISGAEDIFNSLVGPWIEPLHSNYFAVSPLIADYARHAATPSDLLALQKAATVILFTGKPLTTHDIAAAFLLAWQTKDMGALRVIPQNWLALPEGTFASLASDLLWFTFVATAPGDRLIPEDSALSLVLRTIQFRIALKASPNQAAAIVEAWLGECPPIGAGGDPLARLLLAGFVLPQNDVVLSPQTVVDLLGEVAQTIATHPELPFPGKSELNLPELGYNPLNGDMVSTLALFCSRRCVSVDFLDGFIAALEKADDGLRGRILEGFVGGGGAARLAIDRAWLAESDSPTPNWPRCIDVLEHTFKMALDWKVSGLADAAMRGIVVVLDEYVKDHVAAHKALDRLVKDGALNSYHVNDRRAGIYFSEKNYPAAEEQWRIALQKWPEKTEPYDSGAAFAARSAGISAARQGKWEVAAKWFLEAADQWPTDEVHFVAGSYADAGFALWKAGQQIEALRWLIEAWQRTDTLPRGKSNLRAFQTVKLVGHAITWITAQAEGRESGLTEPQPGACSTAELPKGIKDLPDSEPDAVWLFLIQLERILDGGTQARDLAWEKVQSTPSAIVRSMAGVEAIAQSMKDGDIGGLPKQLIELMAAMQNAAREFPEHNFSARSLSAGSFIKNDPLIGSPALLAGMISAVKHAKSVERTIQEWRASLGTVSHAPEWDECVSKFELSLSVGLGEATIAAKSNATADWVDSMLGSLNILLSSSAGPEDLFLAHARWLGGLSASPWLKQTAAMFCELIQAAWLRTIKNRALLRQPSLNIPFIEQACTKGSASLAKAVEILEAAIPAVNTRLSAEMIANIKALK